MVASVLITFIIDLVRSRDAVINVLAFCHPFHGPCLPWPPPHPTTLSLPTLV